MCMSWESVGNHIADCESNEPAGPVLGTCPRCGKYGIIEGHECEAKEDMTTIPAGYWWPGQRR